MSGSSIVIATFLPLTSSEREIAKISSIGTGGRRLAVPPADHRSGLASCRIRVRSPGARLSLSAAGAAVAVNYTFSKEDADRVVADIKANGGEAIAVKGDVTKTDDVRRLFAETKDIPNTNCYEFGLRRGRIV